MNAPTPHTSKITARVARLAIDRGGRVAVLMSAALWTTLLAGLMLQALTAAP